MPPRLSKLDFGPERGAVIPGRDGWLFWALNPSRDVRVRVRAGSIDQLYIDAIWVEAIDEVRVVSGTHKDLPQPLWASDLRGIPLGVLAKALGTKDFADAVREAMASKEHPDFSPRGASVKEARRLAKMARSIVPAARSLVLRVPAEGQRTDQFYEDVTRAYSLALREKRPVGALAKANGVPESTINGWLQEARRRTRRRA